MLLPYLRLVKQGQGRASDCDENQMTTEGSFQRHFDPARVQKLEKGLLHTRPQAHLSGIMGSEYIARVVSATAKLNDFDECNTIELRCLAIVYSNKGKRKLATTYSNRANSLGGLGGRGGW